MSANATTYYTRVLLNCPALASLRDDKPSEMAREGKYNSKRRITQYQELTAFLTPTFEKRKTDAAACASANAEIAASMCETAASKSKRIRLQYRQYTDLNCVQVHVWRGALTCMGCKQPPGTFHPS